MAYTETTTQSWGSRLGDSIKGIIVGFILFIVSFPLLFWNEGNSVKVAKALEEGRGITVEVQDISKIDPANEGKLVHMCGDATTQDVLKDAEFGISHNGMLLRRKVQYYQWVEKSHKETKKNMGGSETTVTTYTYSEGWRNEPVNSSAFKEPGHDNTVSYAVNDREEYAANVQYGAFKFTQSMIERLGNEKTYSLEDYKIPAALRGRACVADKFVYVGRKTAQSFQQQAALGFGQQGALAARAVAQDAATNVERTKLEIEQLRLQVKQQELVQQDPAATAEQKQAAKLAAARAEIEVQQKELLIKQAELDAKGADAAQPVAQQSATPQVQEPAPQEEPCSVSPTDPQIGDVRITWEVISPKEAVSIVYVQTGDTFTPYHAKSDRSVALLGMGIQSAEQLYEHAEDMNTITTWVLRFVGWFLMFGGLGMIFKPLSVLGDVVPFIGSLIGGASSVVAALMALILSLITIAIAWIWYRPLLGIALLAAAVFFVYLLFKRRKKPAPADAETV
ncbi:MAG: TMEM43 family protein [Akkermansia sp.]|nr:TMEM43 family protein [Akkermansia sp.]